jgi:SSS family transporter
MHTVDFVVFYGYLAIVLTIGMLKFRRKQSEKEFFLAGRSFGWFPLGISMMVTMLTAVNFTAFPAEIFQNGCYVLVSLPMFLVVILPISKIFIPFFQKQSKTSAYAFLEEVFDLKTSCLASVLFMFWRIVWMAVALYASASFLGAVTGVSLWLLILLCGAITVMYTSLGGLRAVIWTDVAQFFVLMGGIFIALVLVSLTVDGGFPGIFLHALEHNVFKPAVPYDPKFFSFDPTIRTTLWSGTLGTVVAFMARYGADQMVIQRYMAAKSLDAAKKGFVFNIICAFAILLLLVVLGMAMHSYAAHIDAIGKYPNPLRYMAILIKSLPYGAAGLLVAALMAATMSTVDSGVNACSMTWTKDFYHRFFNKSEVDETHHIRYSVYFSVVIGALIIILAESFILVFGRYHSIFVIFNKVINAMGSPLLALIILGMLKRRPGTESVFWGVIAGTVFSVCISLFVHKLALHYYAVVSLAGTFAFVYLLDFLQGKKGGLNAG